MGLFDKLFGKKPTKPEAVPVAGEKGVVYAAVSGRVEDIEKVPDPVFASEAMGKTVAVWPDEDTVYAPIAGTLTATMPHAFGIAGDDGVEVLIHVGIDTVGMNGEGFSVWVEKGAHVTAGEALVTVDRAKVAKAGHPDIVMTIVTNSDDYPQLQKVAEGVVALGEELIKTA